MLTQTFATAQTDLIKKYVCPQQGTPDLQLFSKHILKQIRC